uniref:Uncharacterized protein n=1 Tax=Anguilla anguilla TaxID=7936 RepID=A0A0E9QQL4_ANGAN
MTLLHRVQYHIHSAPLSWVWVWYWNLCKTVCSGMREKED